MARLGDICTINPKPVSLNDTDQVSFIPMQRVGENGEFDPSEIKEYHEVKKGFTYFKNGDVLFAKITPCMENGKGAIAAGLKNGVGYGSTEFHVLRPNTNYVTSKWLYYLTNWTEFRRLAEKNMTGSAGQKRVPKKFLESFSINLPNISVQNKTTDTLDKINALIHLRRQQLEKLDTLVKSQFIEMFGDPISIDKDTTFPRLGDVCTLKAGKFMKAADISEIACEDSYPCYGGNGVRGYVPSYNCEGDFPLIGRQGALCGNVQYATGKFHATEHAVVVTPKIDMDRYWLYFLLSELKLNRYASGAAQPGLAVNNLEEIRVKIPPVEVQRKYSRMAQQADQSKFAIQQSLDKLETLKKALMQKYFG